MLLSLALSSVALAADDDVIHVDTDQDRIGRVAAELGAGVLGALLPQALWLPFFAFPTAQQTPLLFMFVTGLSLTPVSLATSVWLVHRKMNGQGYWAAALGGTLFGVVLGGAAFALYGYVSNFGRAEYAVLAGAGGAVLSLAATIFMIELHHDRRVSAALAPTPGGAFGAVTVRF